MARRELIELGRLGRPHGIRGEIRVDYYADSLLLLEKPLWLRAGGRPPRPAKVVVIRQWKGQPVIRLEGVDDRSAAETLRGCELLIRESDLPETDPDEPYIEDILGLPVALTDTGEIIGVLADVACPSGQEIWTIHAPGSAGGEDEGYDILFPAAPELVDDIDPAAGLIRISPPPGLLDLYRPEAGQARGPSPSLPDLP